MEKPIDDRAVVKTKNKKQMKKKTKAENDDKQVRRKFTNRIN